MRSFLLFLSLLQTSGLAVAIPPTHGAHPSLLSKYRPTGKTWTCLDGTKTISWTAVNDDYCDCPDGSDEPGAHFSPLDFLGVLQASPGTSACPNNTFYCVNVGHLGAKIPSSRVNDGLCGWCFSSPCGSFCLLTHFVEPTCCDGSDELAGVCENTCAMLGDIYRKEQEAARKLQRTVRIVTYSCFTILIQYPGFQNPFDIHCLCKDREETVRS
jgi:protein kinase C substrate 80K-H